MAKYVKSRLNCKDDYKYQKIGEINARRKFHADNKELIEKIRSQQKEYNRMVIAAIQGAGPKEVERAQNFISFHNMQESMEKYYLAGLKKSRNFKEGDQKDRQALQSFILYGKKNYRKDADKMERLVENYFSPPMPRRPVIKDKDGKPYFTQEEIDDPEKLKKAYAEKLKTAHPSKGGDKKQLEFLQRSVDAVERYQEKVKVANSLKAESIKDRISGLDLPEAVGIGPDFDYQLDKKPGFQELSPLEQNDFYLKKAFLGNQIQKKQVENELQRIITDELPQNEKMSALREEVNRLNKELTKKQNEVIGKLSNEFASQETYKAFDKKIQAFEKAVSPYVGDRSNPLIEGNTPKERFDNLYDNFTEIIIDSNGKLSTENKGLLTLLEHNILRNSMEHKNPATVEEGATQYRILKENIEKGKIRYDVTEVMEAIAGLSEESWGFEMPVNIVRLDQDGKVKQSERFDRSKIPEISKLAGDYFKENKIDLDRQKAFEDLIKNGALPEVPEKVEPLEPSREAEPLEPAREAEPLEPSGKAEPAREAEPLEPSREAEPLGPSGKEEPLEPARKEKPLASPQKEGALQSVPPTDQPKKAPKGVKLNSTLLERGSDAVSRFGKNIGGMIQSIIRPVSIASSETKKSVLSFFSLNRYRTINKDGKRLGSNREKFDALSDLWEASKRSTNGRIPMQEAKKIVETLDAVRIHNTLFRRRNEEMDKAMKRQHEIMMRITREYAQLGKNGKIAMPAPPKKPAPKTVNARSQNHVMEQMLAEMKAMRQELKAKRAEMDAIKALLKNPKSLDQPVKAAPAKENAIQRENKKEDAKKDPVRKDPAKKETKKQAAPAL